MRRDAFTVMSPESVVMDAWAPFNVGNVEVVVVQDGATTHVLDEKTMGRVFRYSHNPHQDTLGQVLAGSPPSPWVPPSTTVQVAAGLLLSQDGSSSSCNYMPIVADGKVTGVVSRCTIADLLLGESRALYGRRSCTMMTCPSGDALPLPPAAAVAAAAAAPADAAAAVSVTAAARALAGNQSTASAASKGSVSKSSSLSALMVPLELLLGSGDAAAAAAAALEARAAGVVSLRGSVAGPPPEDGGAPSAHGRGAHPSPHPPSASLLEEAMPLQVQLQHKLLQQHALAAAAAAGAGAAGLGAAGAAAASTHGGGGGAAATTATAGLGAEQMEALAAEGESMLQELTGLGGLAAIKLHPAGGEGAQGGQQQQQAAHGSPKQGGTPTHHAAAGHGHAQAQHSQHSHSINDSVDMIGSKDPLKSGWDLIDNVDDALDVLGMVGKTAQVEAVSRQLLGDVMGAAANVATGTSGASWAFKYLYDGDCSICRTFQAMLEKMDGGMGRVAFVDIANQSFNAVDHGGINFRAAMETIHILSANGQVFKGVTAVIKLLAAVDADLAASMGFLPAALPIISLAYMVVSKNRHALAGVWSQILRTTKVDMAVFGRNLADPPDRSAEGPAQHGGGDGPMGLGGSRLNPVRVMATHGASGLGHR